MTRLEKLKTLCAAATPEKWCVRETKSTFVVRGCNYLISILGKKPTYQKTSRNNLQKQDAELIAQSRNELPALLTLVEQMAESFENVKTYYQVTHCHAAADKALTAFAAWNTEEDVK